MTFQRGQPEPYYEEYLQAFLKFKVSGERVREHGCRTYPLTCCKGQVTPSLTCSQDLEGERQGSLTSPRLSPFAESVGQHYRSKGL